MTADALPPPMTPPDADLRDFRFYPLDVVRFAQSGLVTIEEPAAVLASILLWGAAWHNVPAGSLPDDDRQLANLAGYGRGVAAFLELKAGALRGWVKCSDGRLYHPVVAEKVEEAWRGKLKQRWRTYGAAIRQHNGRNVEDQRETPSFEDWLEHGRPTVVRGRKAPQQQPLPLGEDGDQADSRAGARAPAHARVSAGEDSAENVTRDKGEESRVTGEGVTRDMGGESRASHTKNGSKGQGQGQGQGQGLDIDSQRQRSTSPPDLLALTSRLASIAGVSVITPQRIAAQMDIVKAWVAEGLDVDGLVIPAIQNRLSRMREEDTVSSLLYFDADIRKRLARKGTPQPRKSAKVEPLSDRDDDDERIPRIRNVLATACGKRQYDSWLGKSNTALHVNGRGLIVRARSRFVADHILTNFRDQLANAARAEGIAGVEVQAL